MIKTTKSQIRQLAAQAIDQLISVVESGKSGQLKAYLAMMGKLYRYSPRNTMLIYLQRSNATHVAGYGRWKQLGRKVKRGEKAIRILAPIVIRKQNDEEDGQERVVTFKSACIFDIDQTEGKSLPEFAQVCGDPGEYTKRLKSFIANRGIDLKYSDGIDSAQGLSCGGRIIVKANLKPAEEFSVIVHELSHEILHKTGKPVPDSTTVREVEVEAVAFVVSQSIGLDCNTSSSDYIQLYDGKKKTLLESLDRIQRTAAEILTAIISERNSLTQPVDSRDKFAEAA